MKNKMNMGKGLAIKIGVESANSTHCLILGTDLELDQSEIKNLFYPVINGKAQVVLGCGTFTSQSSFTYPYVIGNKTITNFYVLLFNSYMKDIIYGIKLYLGELWRKIDLYQSGFVLEVEILAACLHNGIKPYEVLVSYYPQSREVGKGITALDGIENYLNLYS